MLVHMIGNAHIDPVWLWPWQSGADEALATMASAADRCDEYPEFVFTRGEAWVYQQAEHIGLVTNDLYSHSVDGQAWQPTLLRSPKMAWGGGRPATYAGRDRHTDQGVHRFAMALVLGDDLAADDLAEAARQQAQPLIVFDRYEGMNRPAWGPVPPRGLWGQAMLRNLAEGRVADPGSGDAGGLFKRPGQGDAG